MKTADDAQLAAFDARWRSPRGWLGFFTEVNNQQLGVRFMVTSLIFFAIGGFLALLMRIQLTVPENDFMGPQLYNELFTLHGSTMMFLFAVPFLEGLALYVLPLMIGSRDVAFPRLTAFSYWTYLFGGLIFYASLLTGTPPDAGWFAYTPLSGPGFAGLGMDFWVMGLALVEIAGLAAGVEIVVTILKLRAPGMSLRRLPMLAWTLLVSGAMMIFAFSVLLVATLLLELDRAAGFAFFDPDRGGSSLLWQHLFWFFGHPEVYIMFLPATGIVSTLVTTAARRPLAAYPLVAMAVVVTGFVSFGLWMHHMYATGLPELGLSFFAAASLMIGVASGIQIFAWIATLWGSRPRITVPFLYVLGFFFNFVLGGFTGVMVAVVPFDWQVHDTFFIVAHFHYVLIGGVVFPVFAALHYWLPKVTGRLQNERLGRWGFWLNFAGCNLTFFPMHIMGFLGLARRVYTYPEELQIGGYNIVSTLGAFLMAAGFVAIVVDLLRSVRRGPAAGDNPWDTGTLDGSMSSPPPIYSFLRPPVVRSREPLWGPVKHKAGEPALEEEALSERASAALHAAPSDWRATLATDAITGRPSGVQVLAEPSLSPLLSALGLTLAFVGVLLKSYLLIPLGLVLAVSFLARWMYPSSDYNRKVYSSGLAERSGLPVLLEGARSCSWWGMLCFVGIAGSAFVALFFCYFYLWLFAESWPPPDAAPPDPLRGAIAHAPLLLAAGAAWLAKRRLAAPGFSAARGPLLLLSAALAFTVLQLGLGSFELATLPFSPRDHSYGSSVWVMLMVVLTFSLTAALLLACSLARARRIEPWDLTPLRLQLQLTTMFVLLTALAAAGTYAVVHLAPRLL